MGSLGSHFAQDHFWFCDRTKEHSSTSLREPSAFSYKESFLLVVLLLFNVYLWCHMYHQFCHFPFHEHHHLLIIFSIKKCTWQIHYHQISLFLSIYGHGDEDGFIIAISEAFSVFSEYSHCFSPSANTRAFIDPSHFPVKTTSEAIALHFSSSKFFESTGSKVAILCNCCNSFFVAC